MLRLLPAEDGHGVGVEKLNSRKAAPILPHTGNKRKRVLLTREKAVDAPDDRRERTQTQGERCDRAKRSVRS